MKFLRFQEVEFDYLRVTPMVNTRNFNNKDLANSIFKLLSTLKVLETIRNENDKFEAFEVNNISTIAYIIEMSKKDTSFIFRVPVKISREFQSKLQENFKDSLITHIIYEEEQFQFNKYMVYKNNDPLSIHVDSRQQEFINTLVENIEVLNDNEKILVHMTFTPVKRFQRVTFKDYTNDVEKKIKTRQSVATNRGIGKAFTSALINTGVGAVNGLLGSGDSSKSSNNIIDMAFSLVNQEEFKTSAATKNKKVSDLLNATIKVSSNNRKALNSTINSFSALDGDDNALVGCKTLYSNVMSVAEVGQLLQVIGNVELMNKYNISYLKHKEIKLPAEILKGTLRVGTSSYRNTTQDVFISDSGDNKYLATCILAPSRAGKTSYIQNLINDALKVGDSAIFFDFIETCKASNEIMCKLPKDKIVLINLASEKLEGLDFNEVVITPEMTPNQKYTMLKLKANGVIKLVESVNLTNDEDLRSRMKKYLMSATLLVFAQNKPFSYVVNALQDHNIRKNLIKEVPEDLVEFLEDSISNMKELDDKASNGKITGSKQHITAGILNRIYTMQMNVALERMLKTNPENNINLIKEMQKGKAIFIQIPDSIAPTNQEKDIISAFYFNRIWFALQQRALTYKDKERKRLLVVVDEVYQVRNTEALIKERVNQIAKFKAKFIVSAHSINQIKNLKEELISSNASYILIAGADSSNLKDLKERFSNYTSEDLMNLKQYSALCSLKTNSNSYVNCVIDLPLPIKK